MVFILDVYSGVSLRLIVDCCYLCLVSFVLFNITLNTFPVEYSIHYCVVPKANDNTINNNNNYHYTGTRCQHIQQLCYQIYILYTTFFCMYMYNVTIHVLCRKIFFSANVSLSTLLILLLMFTQKTNVYVLNYNLSCAFVMYFVSLTPPLNHYIQNTDKVVLTTKLSTDNDVSTTKSTTTTLPTTNQVQIND